MHVGHYISGAGHAGLIGWLLLGDVFAAEPLPFEVSSVSVITGAEFAAMTARDPLAEAEVPEAPVVPEAVAVPEVEPEPAPEPEPEPEPEPTPPEPEVSQQEPEAPTPPADLSVPVPEVAEEAVPQEADRVAPEAVAQPDPDATPDVAESPAVTPDAMGETVEEPQEATAPEAATTEIVTEATEAPRAAPDQSARPPARRPARPVAQVAEAEETEETPSIADDVAAAVAAAQVAETPAAPSGPPMSAGEKEGLRVAVSACWNVDVGGRSADTVVTVGVSLDRTGKVSGNVRLISSEGGDRASTTTAFNAARRAILRCQKDGYQLPADKYEHWKEVEMTFNPERMRVK